MRTCTDSELEKISMRYDPDCPPDREEWSDLDESERIDLVVDYHRGARIAVPNLSIHASLHVIVENQILMGDETPVAATLGRLTAEGLDRHDAIHAIASVLSAVMFDAMKPQPNGDLNAAYFREVAALTAARWRSQAE